eukprot:scaffold242171_cov22-Tisochrysis_lutea.AAC.1
MGGLKEVTNPRGIQANTCAQAFQRLRHNPNISARKVSVVSQQNIKSQLIKSRSYVCPEPESLGECWPDETAFEG